MTSTNFAWAFVPEGLLTMRRCYTYAYIPWDPIHLSSDIVDRWVKQGRMGNECKSSKQRQYTAHIVFRKTAITIMTHHENMVFFITAIEHNGLEHSFGNAFNGCQKAGLRAANNTTGKKVARHKRNDMEPQKFYHGGIIVISKSAIFPVSAGVCGWCLLEQCLRFCLAFGGCG